MSKADVETDVLIVGTGPAGGSAAAILSTYGVPNMVINQYPWTARTPRAHITNQRTMEVLRDLGLEEEAVALATPAELMGENTYCESLAGEEFGRIRTWGTHPSRAADYALASPTSMCDLPQNLLEPILVRAAAHRGSKVRFDTRFESFEQDDDGVTSRLLDKVTGKTFTVRSKYLIGADGANSTVVEQAGMPVEGDMGLSGSINVVFDADLSRYVEHRPSVLYWVIQPGSNVGGLGIGVVRMVRPWYRWLAIWGYEMSEGPPELTEESATDIVHNLIGDDSIPVKIDSWSTWTVNNAHVARNTAGRVFGMGDAIHRHPPTNGLGSNTSIQDAFNLGWKLAMVLKGNASPTLLDSYDAERTPVSKQVVARANKSLGDFPPILDALGLLKADNPADMRRNMRARKDNDEAGEEQRASIQGSIDSTHYVYNAHGVEMNLRYESDAVVGDGTPEPEYQRDPELYHQHSSRPGAPVPHAWLQRGREQISTVDLCGKGGFALLTGIAGEAWVEAAAKVSAELDVPITVTVIGAGREVEDPFAEFARVRETQESGALLVRPDLIVGWRANELPEDPRNALEKALKKLLARS